MAGKLSIKYKDKAGKWRQKAKQGFSKKSDAKYYAQKNLIPELEKQAKLTTDTSLKDITLRQSAEMYIQHRSIRKATIRNYRHALQRYGALADERVVDITYMQCEEVRQQLIQNYAPNTANASLTALKTFLAYAVNPAKIITESPAQDIQHAPAGKKKIIVLSPAEQQEIMRQLAYNPQYRLMYAIALYTGMRRGEIAALTYDDVDFTAREIKINKQMLYDGSIGPLKTKNGYRTIPVPDILLQMIREYRNLFPRQINGRILHTQYRGTQAPAKTISAVKAGATMHTLRHTYATTLLASGLDVQTVAALLGDSVQMVIDTYIHYSAEMRRKAANTIQAVYSA